MKKFSQYILENEFAPTGGNTHSTPAGNDFTPDELASLKSNREEHNNIVLDGLRNLLRTTTDQRELMVIRKAIREILAMV